MRCRPPTCAIRAIPAFAGSICRRPADRAGRQRALHLPFPRRQRVAGAADGARARSRRRARQHHGRHRARAVRLCAARQSRMPMSASGSIRPASTCATPTARCCVGYVRDGKVHRVAARHAVLACFHMMIPHLMPELRGGAARCAGAERQDADRLHQRAGAELAALGRSSRSARSPRRCRSTAACARLPGQPRRLSPSARSRRADGACISCMSRARRTRASRRAQQFKIGQAKLLQMPFSEFEARIRDELDRMLGAGGFCQRPRHRRDHGQSLAARLRLCGEFAFRRRRL